MRANVTYTYLYVYVCTYNYIHMVRLLQSLSRTQDAAKTCEYVKIRRSAVDRGRATMLWAAGYTGGRGGG